MRCLVCHDSHKCTRSLYVPVIERRIAEAVVVLNCMGKANNFMGGGRVAVMAKASIVGFKRQRRGHSI